MDYNNFIYNQGRNFIFTYVPKVACTNWKCLLRYMQGYSNWLDSKLAHDKVNGGLRYLDLKGPDAELLKQSFIRKYTMVRDPYSRALSAYLNKVEKRLPVKPENEGDDFDTIIRDIETFRQGVLGSIDYPGITFEVFLRWMKDSSSYYTKNEHWAPQVALLRYPEVEYDIIGRFEELELDAQRILSAMKCDRLFPSNKELQFAPVPTSARSKIKHYYDSRCYELVNNIYKADFLAFGYTINYQTGDGSLFD